MNTKIKVLNLTKLGYKDVIGMVERLMREGMEVKKAIKITAQTFKFDELALHEHFEDQIAAQEKRG